MQVMCKRGKKLTAGKAQVNQVSLKDDNEDDPTIWTITGGHREGYHVHLKLNQKPVKMELDTGAAVSVMSEQQWKTLFTESKPLRPYEGKPLWGYSGHEVQVIGQVTVDVEYGSQRKELSLLIVAGEQRPPLLGRDWLHSIKLDWAKLHYVQEGLLQDTVSKFPAVFQKNVGTIKGYKADIRLKEGAKPIFKKSRPVAYALQPVLEAELNRMQKEGILEPIKNSEWATPLVVVPKANGKIRVCGDFKVTINQCVETKQYPLPTVEDIFAHLAGGRVFSKLDMSQAYLQLPVHEDSKPLLVINTPKGLFQYTRLPYGVSVAPAIFQAVMDCVLQGLPVACYLDDILIAAPTESEHNLILEQVLQRLQESGIHLCEEKCMFGQQQVEYLGHCIDAMGIHPTKNKVRAISEAPTPANITQLRAFAGLMNYYAKFIPQVAAHMAPLYKLFQKEQKWVWTEECDSAFQTCKEMLTSEAVLVHYDNNRPIKLACDASSYSLGAVLSHVFEDGEHPVAFASRTLTKAETNYSQIEKEALALIFGIKKFHKYIFGRHFTLITDHKPLLSILNAKSAVPSIAAARMQRWAIFLSAYTYSIEYKGTKQHANADSLSRLPIAGEEDQDAAAIAMFKVSFIDELPITASDIAEETSKDSVLSLIYKYVMEGWPQRGVEDNLKPFYHRKDQLTTDQGCLLWGTRVIIPKVLQSRLLQELHFTHPGVVKMKLLARSYMWWPKIDCNIEEIVKTCKECTAQRSLPPVAPLHSWPWANQPMKRLHIDFAEIEEFQVLVIIDVHSKWIEAIPLRNATATTTIQALKTFFSSFGLLGEIVSDNGPQFTAHLFQTFCEHNGIKHSHTPPYHPASNGAAERAVRVVKDAMKKMTSPTSLSNRLAEFLLMYRSVPHATTGMRPDELFLRRRINTRFTLISPNLTSSVEHQQQKQKTTHDGKKPLVTFLKGEKVLVHNKRGNTKWSPGIILKQKSPVTYLVRVGQRIRYCHADHLLCNGNVNTPSQVDDDIIEVSSENTDTPSSEAVLNGDQETVDQDASLQGPGECLRRSSREKHPPQRLIEEL